MIQVYTGNGKGKTTAAWGLALRAVGRGRRVAVVQFLKPIPSGEQIAAESLSPLISVYGHTRPYDVCADQSGSDGLAEDSLHNFETARELMRSGQWDLLVMDEINMVLHYGFVSRKDMLDFLAHVPDNLEIVLTGRYAPEWLIERADLVTEMREIKHPSAGGIGARKGIEY